jgi:hypothetical protein
MFHYGQESVQLNQFLPYLSCNLISNIFGDWQSWQSNCKVSAIYAVCTVDMFLLEQPAGIIPFVTYQHTCLIKMGNQGYSLLEHWYYRNLLCQDLLLFLLSMSGTEFQYWIWNCHSDEMSDISHMSAGWQYGIRIWTHEVEHIGGVSDIICLGHISWKLSNSPTWLWTPLWHSD